MRKLLFILTALVSFGLGLASQSLFAGGSDPTFEFPEQGSASPPVTTHSSFTNKTGWAIYRFPDNWKVVGYSGTNLGNVGVQLKRKIGTR